MDNQSLRSLITLLVHNGCTRNELYLILPVFLQLLKHTQFKALLDMNE
jgi:hypothetical protein